MFWIILGIPNDLFFNPIKTLSWGIIRVYQIFLSDIQPDVCNFRHDISCSRFGRKAVEKYGFWGILMASDRLQRCNPGSWNLAGSIYDVDGGKLVDTLEQFSPYFEEIPKIILR
ncbi:MAG: membrane protein insertion efficiency factor YidD [candidate division WOR-3 bacterium]